jgi:hypothetical protein
VNEIIQAGNTQKQRESEEGKVAQKYLIRIVDLNLLATRKI